VKHYYHFRFQNQSFHGWLKESRLERETLWSSRHSRKRRNKTNSWWDHKTLWIPVSCACPNKYVPTKWVRCTFNRFILVCRDGLSQRRWSNLPQRRRQHTFLLCSSRNSRCFHIKINKRIRFRREITRLISKMVVRSWTSWITQRNDGKIIGKDGRKIREWIRRSGGIRSYQARYNCGGTSPKLNQIRKNLLKGIFLCLRWIATSRTLWIKIF